MVNITRALDRVKQGLGTTMGPAVVAKTCREVGHVWRDREEKRCQEVFRDSCHLFDTWDWRRRVEPALRDSRIRRLGVEAVQMAVAVDVRVVVVRIDLRLRPSAWRSTRTSAA